MEARVRGVRRGGRRGGARAHEVRRGAGPRCKRIGDAPSQQNFAPSAAPYRFFFILMVYRTVLLETYWESSVASEQKMESSSTVHSAQSVIRNVSTAPVVFTRASACCTKVASSNAAAAPATARLRIFEKVWPGGEMRANPRTVPKTLRCWMQRSRVVFVQSNRYND